MANWKYKNELNKVIREMSEKHDLSNFEEPCPEEVKTAIVAELDKAEPLQRFRGSIKNAKTIAALNRILGRVFDEADLSKVWCGL